MPRHAGHCIVKLLDGNELVIDVHKMKTSSEFLEHVCGIAGLKEKAFFGFSYLHPKDGKRSWIEFEKPFSRQIKKAGNNLSLEIQFYPVSSQLLHCLKSIYYFVLQTRKNIVSGHWSCSIPSHALLTSLLVQGEFGDYEAIQKDDPNYLQGLTFFPSQPATFLESVKLFHARRKSMTPLETDLCYLESARKMKYYGMDIHSVLDEDSNVITLGSNLLGIHIFYQDVKLHSFGWKIVSRITSHARELFVYLKPLNEKKNEEVNVAFTCVSHVDASRIEKSFSVQKDFYTGLSPRLCERDKASKQPDEACEHKIATKEVEINFDRISSKKLMELVTLNKLNGQNFVHEDNGEEDEANTSKTDIISSSDPTNESFSDEIANEGNTTGRETASPVVNLSLEKMQEILDKAASHAEKGNSQQAAMINKDDFHDVSETDIITDDAVKNTIQTTNEHHNETSSDIENSFENIE